MRLCVLVGAVALLPVFAAAAQEVDCATATAPAAETFCLEKEYETENRRLAALVEELKFAIDEIVQAENLDKRLNPAAALMEGQKAWFEYRKKTCDWESTLAFGGAGMGGRLMKCLRDVTRERVKDFDRALLDLGGRL